LPEGHVCRCNLAASGCNCLLVEAVFIMSDRGHDEYETVYAFRSNQGGEGTFLRDLSVFYQGNIDSIQAQFPEITLCPEDFLNVNLIPTPVLEETIRQFVGAE